MGKKISKSVHTDPAAVYLFYDSTAAAAVMVLVAAAAAVAVDLTGIVHLFQGRREKESADLIASLTPVSSFSFYFQLPPPPPSLSLLLALFIGFISLCLLRP